MTHEDAVEYLDVNKVEPGIRSAAQAGAVVYTVLLDLDKFNRTGEEDGGIVIFSTSRRRNLRLLTDTDNRFVPLGTARLIPATQRLELRPRRRFENDAAITRLFEARAKAALHDDPDLRAILAEYAGAIVASKDTTTTLADVVDRLMPEADDRMKRNIRSMILCHALWSLPQGALSDALGEPGTPIELVFCGTSRADPSITIEVVERTTIRKAMQALKNEPAREAQSEIAEQTYEAVLRTVFATPPAAVLSI